MILALCPKANCYGSLTAHRRFPIRTNTRAVVIAPLCWRITIKNQSKLCISHEPEVSALPINTPQSDEVRKRVHELFSDVYLTKDFGDLKYLVIRFIGIMGQGILSNEDLLALAAGAVMDRGRSMKAALRMFEAAYKHEQREAEFWGDVVRK